MPVLIITLNDDVRVIDLPEGKLVYIGRAVDCDVCITSPTVSRRHAVFLNQNGYCGVKDLGSNNGTLLNDKLLNHSVLLRDGDTVKISRYPIVFKNSLTSASSGDRPGKTRILISPSVPSEAERGGSSKTAIRLPRSMTSANYLDEMLSRAVAVPDVQSGGEDTRILGKDRQTGLRRRDDAPATIIPGESGRLGPRVSSSTAIIVKKDLARDDSRASAGQSPLVSDNPAVPEEGTRRSSPGVFTFKTDSPGAELVRESAGIFEKGSDSEPEASGSGTEVLESVEEVRESPVMRRRSHSVVRYADGRSSSDTSVVLKEKRGGVRKDSSSTRGGRAVMHSSDTGFGTKRADSVVMHSRRAAELEDGQLNRGGAIEAAGEEVYNERRRLSGQEALVVSAGLREAVDVRFKVYGELERLSEMRRSFRKKNPDLPSDVVSELERQDEECNRLPLLRQVKRLMSGGTVADSGGDGKSGKAVARLAMKQWRVLADSATRTLPGILSQSYELTAREPLRAELEKADIDAVPLLGGAMYYLVLEKIREEAESELAWKRHAAKDEIPPGPDRSRGNTIIRLLYDMLSLSDGSGDAEENRIRKQEEAHAKKLERIDRELAFVERNLVQDFRAVYSAAAAHFVPMLDAMPLCVRAFLRFGAISFRQWWMDGEVQNRIVFDCSGKVRESFDDGVSVPGGTVLYADEYLQFVMKGECSPSPGERFGGLDEDVGARRGFERYRDVIDGDVRVKLLEGLVASLDGRRRDLGVRADELSATIEGLERGGGLKRGELLKLRRELHVLREDGGELEESAVFVRDTMLPETRRRVAAAEASLSSGECVIPGHDMLVRRECDIIAWVAAELGGGGERFMPLVLRDRFVVRSDVVVDRAAALDAVEREGAEAFSELIGESVGRVSRALLRQMPIIVIAPMFADRGRVYWGREGMERGRVLLPVCLGLAGIREGVFGGVFADFSRRSQSQQ